MSHQQLSQTISSKRIKKAVLSTSLQRPLTVYPASIGMVGVFYALLFGANPFALGALIAGGGITVLNWLYEFFIKGDQHANEYVTQFRKELERRRTEALQYLEEELKMISNDQAIHQMTLFRNKYDNFHSILDKKLDATELTYNRYLTIAEQVFLNGLDNLENAAIALKSISAIDHERIVHEIKKLETLQDGDSQSKMSELKTRMALRDNQLDRVNGLLLTNEKALTQLDHVTTRIANIDTKQNRAYVDMEDAMEELRHLISRAEHYSE